jgi:hypothetical protein
VIAAMSAAAGMRIAWTIRRFLAERGHRQYQRCCGRCRQKLAFHGVYPSEFKET